MVLSRLERPRAWIWDRVERAFYFVRWTTKIFHICGTQSQTRSSSRQPHRWRQSILHCTFLSGRLGLEYLVGRHNDSFGPKIQAIQGFRGSEQRSRGTGWRPNGFIGWCTERGAPRDGTSSLKPLKFEKSLSQDSEGKNEYFPSSIGACGQENGAAFNNKK